MLPSRNHLSVFPNELIYHIVQLGGKQVFGKLKNISKKYNFICKKEAFPSIYWQYYGSLITDVKYKNLPLIWAVIQNHKEQIPLLFKYKDCDPNEGDNAGRTPLHYAVKGGNESVVRLLLKHKKINPNKIDTAYGNAPIHDAVEAGHINIVRLLFNDKRVAKHIVNNDKLSPLHVAVYFGKYMIVKFFLTHNPQINIKSSFGATPLALANRYGHTKIANLLVTHGAIDSWGSKPKSYGCTCL